MEWETEVPADIRDKTIPMETDNRRSCIHETFVDMKWNMRRR